MPMRNSGEKIMHRRSLSCAGFCIWSFIVLTACPSGSQERDTETIPASPPRSTALPQQQENRGVIDSRTGEHLPPSGTGVSIPGPEIMMFLLEAAT